MSDRDLDREFAEPIVAPGAGASTRHAMIVPCPECRASITAAVLIEPERHACRCSPPCPPERLEWSPVDDVECPSCDTVIPVVTLANLIDLDEAVQYGREQRS